MADLAQHACEHRALLMLDRAADLAEAERAQRAAMALALADLAPHLGDLHFRHLLVVLLLAEADAALRLLLRLGLCRSGGLLDDRRFLGDGLDRWRLLDGSSLLDGGLFDHLRLDLRLRRRALLRFRRHHGRRGSGSRCLLLGRQLLDLRQRQHLADLLAPDPRDVLRTPQRAQRDNGGLRHVDRVRRAEALREHVADTAELEHRADAAAGDHAGTFGRGPQHDPGRVEAAENLVRDRRAVLRNREHVLLRVLDRLRDGERNLARLAVADADAIDLVADDDERRERETPAALDDLGDAIDLDHALLELASLVVIQHPHQNCRPPSRAPSASAFTRPW